MKWVTLVRIIFVGFSIIIDLEYLCFGGSKGITSLGKGLSVCLRIKWL